MADRLTRWDQTQPGGDAVYGRKKWSSISCRKNASTGQLERDSIPGYTGHIPGRNSENVSGVTHADACKLSETACNRRMVPRSGADSERTRQWRGFDMLAQTIDMGSMNTGLGTSNMDGLTQSTAEHGPTCKTTSMFYNPHGHTKFRSGAAIPGYAGHIPGKYAGNVFATTYAQSNMAASGVRRREGAENTTNWILACEFDKEAKNHGSPAELRKTIRTIGFHEGTRNHEGCGARTNNFDSTVTKPFQQTRVPKVCRHEQQLDRSAWRLHEPASTHQKLRCYGH